MKAMILAAGRGQRMGKLTETLPKPLLSYYGKTLIEHRIEDLKKAGIVDIVINVRYLANKIMEALGDGSHLGVHIQYSIEYEAFDTGGGIRNALPLLGEQPFIVVNCDNMTDYPLNLLKDKLTQLAHIVLVDNPDHHPAGDFSLTNKQVMVNQTNDYTFSSMGIYHPQLFLAEEKKCFSLGDLLRKTCHNHQVTGEYFEGKWFDIGTPERLQTCELDYRNR